MSQNKNKIIKISLSLNKKLSKKRFISKNTILISNIPLEIFSKEILNQKKYLGQYGHINHIYLFKNEKKLYSENNAIIQFDTVNQAALAIISLENFNLRNNIKLKISFLNTKYCSYFLKNQKCLMINCFYIHNLKINNYLYKEIQFNEIINNFNLALNILDVSILSFSLIFEKLIGYNYYKKKKKFPKIKIKKLKNKILLKNIFEEYKKVKIKEKIFFKFINDNSINQLKDNISFSKYLISNRQLEHSRFQFVNNKINIEESVYVPEFIIKLIKNLIFSNLLNKVNNVNWLFNEVNINDFNINWFDLLLLIIYGESKINQF